MKLVLPRKPVYREEKDPDETEFIKQLLVMTADEYNGYYIPLEVSAKFEFWIMIILIMIIS